MINKVYSNGFLVVEKWEVKEALCISKLRWKLYWKLETEELISDKDFQKSHIEIECTKCGKKIEINNFYYYLNFRKYICFHCNLSGENNPFYGKKHQNDFRNRLSEERKGKWCIGDKNGMFGVNIWDTYTEEEKKDKKRKISELQMGEKNIFFGKHHTDETRKMFSEKAKKYLIEHPDHIRKMTEASLKKQSSGFKSSIEKIVQLELEKRNIKFRYNKILHRKYQYDFIIGDNILLEVHGDYWHANPLIYGDGKKTYTARQLLKIDLDIKKIQFAIEYGYKYFKIWEMDINKKDFSVIDTIEKEILNKEK